MNWKVNLVVLWFGQFLVMSGMTMITPFLPLYIQELGITDEHRVAIWSGAIFAANFLTSFIAQPIWGKLSDRYGRKIMLLRSGFGMSAVMVMMGFAGTAWQLLLLRLLNGTISGFVPAAVALVSASAPRSRMGFAMGSLQSGSVAGSILGPFLGGLMAKWFDYRPIFYITGASLFVASLLAMFLVKEQFDKAKAREATKETIMEGWKKVRTIPQLPALFAVTFMIQFAVLSVNPILPLFIQHMNVPPDMLSFYAGLVSAVMGLSNMLFSPFLGRFGDRFGAERVLFLSLVCAGVTYVPQALVMNVWQLVASRFLLGFCLGGLLPSVNTLIRKFTPDGMESRSYSFNSSFLSLGNMVGPLIGGLLSGWITIRGVFMVSCAFMLLNALWVRKVLVRGRRVALRP